VENKYALSNLGTLTIKDSKGGGQVNAKGIYNGYSLIDGVTDIVSSAELTIEGGTYNCMNKTVGSAVYNHGIVVLNGGTFDSLGGYTLSNQSGSEMTINGNVKVTNGIYNTGATLTINGGEFSATGDKNVLFAENSTVTINGGTFTGEFQVSGGTLTDNRNKQ
jgi:hypothetical protein